MWYFNHRKIYPLNMLKMMRLLSTILVFSSCVALRAQVPSYVPSGNLVSWWGFNGDASDAVGTNNFTVNAAALTADRNSVSNSAYQFNGTNQSLKIDVPSFSFGQTSTFTVSFWMQRVNQGYGVTMMHGSAASGNFIWNFQTGSTGNFQFGSNKQGSAWVWIFDTYTTSVWEHYVGTYNNGSMVLYKDGVQAGTASNSYTGVSQTTLPFYVGRGPGGAFFEGRVDDIGIWDRVLTQAEITTLFVGCGSIAGQPANLTASIAADATFGVTAGAGANIQWQEKVGPAFQDLVNGGQYSGVTSDTLTVTSVTTANSGEIFRCIVEGGTPCADTSAEALLTVCESITQQPIAISATAGATAQFSITYSNPAAAFQWETDNGLGFISVSNGGPYSGANSATLTVSNLALANSGQKFRCKVDTGACAQTSGVVILTVNPIGLEELTLDNSLSIYPNPAKGKLNVEVSAAFAKSAYSIVNAAGKTVTSGTLSNTETSLNLTHYPAGYYILQVANAKRGFIIAQ